MCVCKCPCGACLSFLFVANQHSQSYFAHVLCCHFSDEEAHLSFPFHLLSLFTSLLFSFTLHTCLLLLPSLPLFPLLSITLPFFLFVHHTRHSLTHSHNPLLSHPQQHFNRKPWTRQSQPHPSRPSSSPSALPRAQPSPPPSPPTAPFSSSRRNSPPLTCLLPRFVSSTPEESSRMTTNSLSTVSALYIPTKYFFCMRMCGVLCVMMALIQEGCPLRKCEQGMAMQQDKSYFLLSLFVALCPNAMHSFSGATTSKDQRLLQLAQQQQQQQHPF